MNYNIEFYTKSSGKNLVKQYILELLRTGQQKEVVQMNIFIDQLQLHGLDMNDKFKRESIKKLKPYEHLYELRVGSNRVLFYIDEELGFVLLHAFKKKSEKTPKVEIEKALKEKNDHENRKQI